MQKYNNIGGFRRDINQFSNQVIDLLAEKRQELGRNEAARRSLVGSQVEKKRKKRARPFGRKASSAFANNRCALEGDIGRYAICIADVFCAWHCPEA